MANRNRSGDSVGIALAEDMMMAMRAVWLAEGNKPSQKADRAGGELGQRLYAAQERSSPEEEKAYRLAQFGMERCDEAQHKFVTSMQADTPEYTLNDNRAEILKVSDPIVITK